MADAELDEDTAGALEELEAAGPLRKTRLRLETDAAIRTHLIKIYAAAREGRMSSLEANRLTKILLVIGQSNERISIERRLAKLEAVEESRRRSTRR
jgi:hypothetical protein